MEVAVQGSKFWLLPELGEAMQEPLNPLLIINVFFEKRKLDRAE
jgi:hypothetical protein